MFEPEIVKNFYNDEFVFYLLSQEERKRKMTKKITKSELRRIIREAVREQVEEDWQAGDWIGEFLWEEIDQVLADVVYGKKEEKEALVEILSMLKRWNVPPSQLSWFDKMPGEYEKLAARIARTKVQRIADLIKKKYK